MKQLLAAQELLFPRLFTSLLTAIKPLMARNRTGIESNKTGVESIPDKRTRMQSNRTVPDSNKTGVESKTLVESNRTEIESTEQFQQELIPA
jgi:hypothetical protein